MNSSFWNGGQVFDNQAETPTKTTGCFSRPLPKVETQEGSVVKAPTRLRNRVTAKIPVTQNVSVGTLPVGRAIRVARFQTIIYRLAESVFLVFNENFGQGSVHYSATTVPALDGELLPVGTTINFAI